MVVQLCWRWLMACMSNHTDPFTGGYDYLSTPCSQCRLKFISVSKTGSWLTHWGWDKIAAIFQTTFSNAFSSMKLCEFWLRFHWNLFLSVKLTIFQHWLRCADQATSDHLNQWWLVHWRIYASLGLNELTTTTPPPPRFQCCGYIQTFTKWPIWAFCMAIF